MSSRLAALPRRAVAVALAVVVLGGAFAVTRVGGESDGDVRTASVTRAALRQTISAPGVLTTAGDIRLAFKVPGKLAQVGVTVGQRVSAGQALAKLDTTDLEIALAQAQAAVQSAQARYDQVAAGASPEDVNLARQAVDNAGRTLEEARRTADNDVATAQQSLSRIRNGYAASRTTFTSLAQSVANDAGALQAMVATAKQQTGPLANDIQNSSRQTTDVLAARNSVIQADASVATAVSTSAGQLQSALDDYAAARDGLLAAILRFDSALAAGADTAGLASDYQLAGVAYSAAAAKLAGALDATSASLAAAQVTISLAQASLSNAITRTYPDLEQSRTEALALQSTLTATTQAIGALKAKLAQTAASLQVVGDAVSGAYAAAVQSSAAAQERSNAAVVNAQNGLGSAQASLARTAAAPRAFDIAAAYAAVLGAQAAGQQAQANLDAATLRAPSAAIVAQVNNRVGEQLAPAGAFMVLQNVSAFVVRVTVGESAIALLEVGQPATVTIDALGKATALSGRVTAIDPGATVQLGIPVYGADVTLDAPDPRVRAGMSASASVVVASKPDALVVPAVAIRSQGGRRSVQVLREGKLVDIEITVGISADGMTEIASGLREGDRVVVPEPRTLLVR